MAAAGALIRARLATFVARATSSSSASTARATQMSRYVHATRTCACTGYMLYAHATYTCTAYTCTCTVCTTYTCMCTYACTYIHTYIHTYICTHIRTYIHATADVQLSDECVRTVLQRANDEALKGRRAAAAAEEKAMEQRRLLLQRLLKKLCTASTYSVVYVPFAHAVIGRGSNNACILLCACIQCTKWHGHCVWCRS